jgi:excisionase family DNA binding protein
MTTAPDDLLTPGEVAFLTHVNPRTVARWADAGDLPVAETSEGGHRRFRRADVEAFMSAPDGIRVYKDLLGLRSPQRRRSRLVPPSVQPQAGQGDHRRGAGPVMAFRGRPPIGPVREFAIPDDLNDRLRGEARQLGIPYAELLRRILTERYERNGDMSEIDSQLRCLHCGEPCRWDDDGVAVVHLDGPCPASAATGDRP